MANAVLFAISSTLLQDRTQPLPENVSVSWPQLSTALRVYSKQAMGAKRGLTDNNMNYLANMIYGTKIVDYESLPPITFQQFAHVRRRKYGIKLLKLMKFLTS